MSEDLIREAEQYGINASMYYLLPPKKREKALQKDIQKAKKARQKAVAKGDSTNDSQVV